MAPFVGIALGWLTVGSLIAVAVLAEHFRTGDRVPWKLRWWLIPVLVIVWPWAVWVWCDDTKTARPTRMGLAICMLTALGLGWGAGLKLYDLLYPKELEPPDVPALNAMIEGLISNPTSNNERTQVGVPPKLFTFR